ncbi:MAG: hypothetical protein V7K57_15740 [Nostoc sp.]|uniref:hypothetical protein n=1 Tax=Nostoc sp. TaxID=1180 RepID=UPI002FF6F608
MTNDFDFPTAIQENHSVASRSRQHVVRQTMFSSPWDDLIPLTLALNPIAKNSK